MKIKTFKQIFWALFLTFIIHSVLLSTNKSEAFTGDDEQKHRELFRQAINLCDAKNYQSAIIVLQKSTQVTSSYKCLGDSYTLMGALYFELKNYELAIENCKKAISYQPLNFRAYSVIGDSYFQREEYENALPFLNKALIMNQNEFDVYYTLSLCYLKTKKWQEVVQNATQYISKHHNTPKEVILLYFHRGLAYHSMDHGIEALKDFKTAIFLNKKYGVSFLENELKIELGLVLYSLKSLQTASEYKNTLKELGLTQAEAEQYILDAENTGKKFYS